MLEFVVAHSRGVSVGTALEPGKDVNGLGEFLDCGFKEPGTIRSRILEGIDLALQWAIEL